MAQTNFPKDVVVEFNNMVEDFEDDNILSKNVKVKSSSAQQQQRTAYRTWQNVPQISTTVSGLDITSSMGKAITQLAIPVNIDTIENVPFTVDAQDQNDPAVLSEKIRSAGAAISSKINQQLVNLALYEGGAYVSQSGALASYNDVAAYENAFLRRGIPDRDMQSLFLNLKDHGTVAGNIADRQTMGNKVLTAYERSLISDAANFDVFRVGSNPILTAAAGAASTAGGDQSLVPAANTTNPTTGNVSNVDNRSMNLTVTTTASMKAGDRFTVDGVNEVHLVTKQNTGELQTFTINEVIDGTTLKIFPAAIDVTGASDIEKEYGNVTGPIPDATALTFVNTADAPVNVFWKNDSVQLNGGNLSVSDLSGVGMMNVNSDSGIQFILANEGVIGDLSNQYRMTAFWGVTGIDPLRFGIGQANQ
jgi:hypothetical protein